MTTEVESGELARLTTALQQTQSLLNLSVEILRILNSDLGFPDAFGAVVAAIKRSTGWEAVGIRLPNGDDFSYFSEDGFSSEFPATKSPLVARSLGGDLCRHRHGKVCLECICGLVISGQTDPTNPLFTTNGSCWVNRGWESPGLSQGHDHASPNARNSCLHDGYSSVALIPVRANREIVGLLQLSDRRRDCFTLETIQFFEGLSAGIGLALTRKKAEESLRNSETQYRMLFMQMSEGFALHEIICDGDGDGDGNGDGDGKPVDYRYLNVNPAFERMTGIKAADAVGKTVRQLWPNVAMSRVEDHGKVALSGESVEREGYDEALQRHYRSVIFCPQKGQFATLFEDITDRKRVETELQESHEMLARLTAQVPGVVYQYRLYPDGRSCFPFSSPGMQAIYEVTPEEVRCDATPVFGMLHPEDYDDVSIAIRESARTLQLFHCEFRVVLPRQGLRWRLSDAVPERLPDGSTLWYGIISDVTDRKLAEEALRDKHAELERFTYTVSHDLKSPLVTIKTFLAYLERDLKSSDAAGVAKDFGFIRNAADKMSQLLDELLKLSRVGRMTNPSVEVPLRDVVNDALSLVAGRIASRDIAVKVADEPILLFGDRPRLVELFQNLLDNAAKFMGEQPTPRIEVGVEHIRDEFQLYVRDNGIGFDRQHRDRLFGLFQRLDSSMEGTGIGLTLVQRIVQVHAGKIWAESDGPGLGATFRFTLAHTRRAADRVNADGEAMS